MKLARGAPSEEWSWDGSYISSKYVFHQSFKHELKLVIIRNVMSWSKFALHYVM